MYQTINYSTSRTSFSLAKETQELLNLNFSNDPKNISRHCAVRYYIKIRICQKLLKLLTGLGLLDICFMFRILTLQYLQSLDTNIMVMLQVWGTTSQAVSQVIVRPETKTPIYNYGCFADTPSLNSSLYNTTSLNVHCKYIFVFNLLIQEFSHKGCLQKQNCSEGDIGPFSFYPLPPQPKCDKRNRDTKNCLLTPSPPLAIGTNFIFVEVS